ncbi:MAG: hypothetical protein E6R03_16575 [Hyphomicrobiaceae bacterium]|nr:MAG: hypothetical protein E6R03_16575 [Hyphomicrobiaceae bacterium]
MDILSIPDIKALGFLLGNLDIVDDIGEAGVAFFQADSYTDRWEAIKRAGDLVAPRIDSYFAMPRELHEDISYDKVLNALAELPAARAPGRPPRDGKWLQGAIQLFNLLLPIITSLVIQKG